MSRLHISLRPLLLIVFIAASAFSIITTSQKVHADPSDNPAVICAESGGTWKPNDKSEVSTCQDCPSNMISNGATCALATPDTGSVTQCQPKSSFLGFPTWYKYLKGDKLTDTDTGAYTCSVKLDGLRDIWKIVAALVELLLRLGALIAIGFVVFGGILYTVSQGQPDKTKTALRTIIDALVGLTITIVATAIVSFVAGRF